MAPSVNVAIVLSTEVTKNIVVNPLFFHIEKQPCKGVPGLNISPDAKIKIKSYRRNEFLKNELQRFFIQIYTLNISMEEIDLMYKQFIDK